MITKMAVEIKHNPLFLWQCFYKHPSAYPYQEQIHQPRLIINKHDSNNTLSARFMNTLAIRNTLMIR